MADLNALQREQQAIAKKFNEVCQKLNHLQMTGQTTGQEFLDLKTAKENGKKMLEQKETDC